MKYVHENHEHVYYVSKDPYGYTVRTTSPKVAGSLEQSLDMNSKQYENFERMMKDGGWNESARR